MGVQGLWSLVKPASRPTQLESLRQKRIAVDASIWIHQFMRTMRDKEGNELRNGHLLGFFRRICKLLFYNIKPVFVFDGGAPALKRTTIRERRQRREGIRMSLRNTARKILSAQVKSRIIMEEEKKAKKEMGVETENYVYYDELEKNAAKEVLKKKVKLDPYELPEINEEVLKKEDPRIATTDELKDFIREFAPEELNVDPDAFAALPAEMQYEIIQDIKLKARQTSWARLEAMIRSSPTALDFSKHQIKLLKHRNRMTQRVMQLNNVVGGVDEVQTSRIAGERGRQYVLYKNENINEGLGWKLPGLDSTNPVVVDQEDNKAEVVEDEQTEENEDKVKAAISKNPKLAALFSDILSDEEEDEQLEMDAVPMGDTTTVSEDEDEPLFVGNSVHTNDLVPEDMTEYEHQDLVDNNTMQVIHRIYQDDYESTRSVPDMEDEEMLLDADGLYTVWLTRVPDSFIYLHSLNDEYMRILRTAIDDDDIDQNKKSLASVEKKHGKIKEGDELALESYRFHEAFLRSVINWKQMRISNDNDINNLMRAFEEDDSLSDKEHSMSPKLVGNESPFIMDDEEEEDIQFMEVIPHDTVSSHPSTLTKKEIIPAKDDLILNDSVLNNDTDHVLNTPDTSVLEEDISSKETNVNNISNKDTGVKDISNNEMGMEDGIVPKKDENVSVEDDHVKLTQEDQDEIIRGGTVEEVTVDHEKESLRENNVNEVINEISNDVAVVQDKGYNSEDELEEHVQGEDEEFARFVSDIASKNINEVKEELYADIKELNKQQRKDRGNADDITDQMVQDIQELLKLFGIPYIVSPMEAEAQCAHLEQLKLVEGTVTDDSDVFLFGASRVYKNMFTQQKYVECYLSQDIEREMQLDRDKLIQLAYLLGSDYTEGIVGVGPVTAMEILAEFSTEEEESLEGPLIKFRDWYNSGIDTTEFQRKFRNRHKDLEIPDDFPNSLVKEAYYYPTVDESKQELVWGHPQLDSLRIFLMEAFGWQEEKADQVLLPVVREMNQRVMEGEQQTISSFFNTESSTAHHINQHSSKRVQSIVDKWKKNKKSKK